MNLCDAESSLDRIEFFPTWSENKVRIEIFRDFSSTTTSSDPELSLSPTSDNDVELRLSSMISNDVVHVFIPQFFGLDISLNEGSIVQHDKIEASNGFVNLFTRHGSIFVHKLRTEQIDLSSPRGKVNVGAVVEGSVRADCHEMNAKQVLGPYFRAITQDNIDVGALYCANSEMNSSSGDVNIGNVQGSCLIRNFGDVNIISAVGELDVVTEQGDISVHLEKCVRGAKHNFCANTGRVTMTAATPVTTRADFAIFPDCDGIIVCDTKESSNIEKTEFNAHNAVSETLSGVLSDSGASSSLGKTTGKISEAGRDMAAMRSASSCGSTDENFGKSEELCLIQATASRGIEFTAKTWRQMMEERMMQLEKE